MDTVRPVAVKDFWVVAPVKQFIDVRIVNLIPDNAEIRSAIEDSIAGHDVEPGQAWSNDICDMEGTSRHEYAGRRFFRPNRLDG